MNEHNLVYIPSENSSMFSFQVFCSFGFAWNFNSIKLHPVMSMKKIQNENALEFDNNHFE